MILAIAGAAFISFGSAFPHDHITQVQSTSPIQLQPFTREALIAAKKECAVRLVKNTPDAKFLGDFVVAIRPQAVRISNETLARLINKPPDDVIVVAVPAMIQTMFGEARRNIGCAYNIRNKQLVFDHFMYLGIHIPKKRS